MIHELLTLDEIKSRVKASIVQALNLDISPESLSNDQLIFDSKEAPGLTSDSLSALEIVAAISNEFNIVPTEINTESFHDIDSLSEFISNCLKEQQQ